MYKKITSFILLVLMLLTIVGCKENSEDHISGDAKDTTPETTEVTIPGVEQSSFEDIKPVENTGKQTEEPTLTETIENSGDANQTLETFPTINETTEPDTTEEDQVDNSDTATKPIEIKPAVVETEYEKYIGMSGTQQKDFMESFGSMEEFFAWLQNAKAEYEAAHPEIPIEDGTIDLSKIG